MGDCSKCLWAGRDGSCHAWDCEFIEMEEAYKAYKREGEKHEE